MLLMHIFIILLALLWRKNRFRKCIHKTSAGIGLFIGSILLVIGESIGLYFDNDINGILYSVIGYAFLSITFFVIICYFMTFCIYIDGNYVVKRSLLRKSKIYLKEKRCIIKLDGLTVRVISQKNGINISFYTKRIEGDWEYFIYKCKEIAYTDYDNKDNNIN